MFLAIAAVLFIFLILWFKYILNYWKRRGIPGPRAWPVVGNVTPFLLGRKTIGEIYGEIYKKYDEYPFVGTFRANTPVLLVRDPELVNRILLKDFKSFRYNEAFVNKETDPLFGRNPFVLRDQEWKNTRQLITPGMTSGKMKAMYPILSKVVEKFLTFIEDHPTAMTDGIETRGLTKRLTIDFVANVAFGIDGKSFESYDDISEFNKLADKFLAPGTLFAVLASLSTVFPSLLNVITVKFVSKETTNKLMKIVSEVVRYRKTHKVEASDYLQHLISVKDGKLEDIEITGHTCTFFIDAYETSSLALSWLLFNLAENPIYQEKIRNDIAKYESDNNGLLTYDAVHEMTWLNCCFYETLRLNPVASILTKVCTERFEYTPAKSDFKKITIKFEKGDLVAIPYGLLCNDKKYVNNPNEFMPERMLSGNMQDKTVFFPFGDGPRACIGQRLGIMQVKLGAAHILKHFELSVSSKQKKPPTLIPFHILNELQGGYWIRYKKINR